MDWHAVDAPDVTQDMILFDGDCVLCSHAAHFVHRHDGATRFKFVAIQSPFGRALARRFGIDADAPQTNMAIVDRRASFRADAALAVLAVLPGWRWTAVARVLPRGLRNWIYDHVARNRYQWFGRRAQCWAGDPRFRARILDQAP
ncbi:MAG: DUF393 domain-containing protein [Caulobacterales bacterium]|jgi:predicted DCC family thiol-disulfide oxidoreductase YuxK|nr:DUF393 domain-containing protein [Caulobacterales bacterium]